MPGEGARETGRDTDALVRERICGAMLATCGELGYREASVQAVLERGGASRAQFYRHFENKGDCYARAYAIEAEQLTVAILVAGAEATSWREGLHAALSVLAGYARADETRARGLLAEVHVARGAALAQHAIFSKRLSRALDSARREPGCVHSPPPLAANFMVSAIEHSVVRALTRRCVAEFADDLTEIERLICRLYFA